MKINLIESIKPDRNGRRVLRWEVFSNIRNNNLLESLLQEQDLQIELEGIDIISHDGLIWVGFLCLYRSLNKLHTVVMLPNDRDKVDYIRYLDFDSLQNRIGFSFANEYLLWSPQTKYRLKKETPLSLRRIHLVDETNWPAITNSASHEVTKFLTEQFNLQGSNEELFKYLEPFSGTIRELILNIALHGGVEEGRGIGLVAYTPPPRGYRRLRFCCNDVGGGFKNVLTNRRNLKCATDKDSIIEALLFRFFRKDQGIVGLFPTLAYIRNREGAISIRSGNVLATLDLGREETIIDFDRGYRNPSRGWLKKLIYFSERPFVPGSHIVVDLTLPGQVKQ